MIKPISDWRWVLARAWSVRFLALAAVLSGIEVVITILTAYSVDTGLPPGAFAGLAGLVTIAAFIARFIAQRDGS